jgi:hypothetical protein
MNQLEFLYEQDLKKSNFLPRKRKISAKKTIICGAKKSGKSYIIFDALHKRDKKKFLYIDFLDFRVDKESVMQNLSTFIDEKKITLLVLENFDFSYQVPDCEEVIISTVAYKELDNFESITVFPLDFEEFIAFDRHKLDPQNIFNYYSSIGTYPQIVLSEKTNIGKNFQNLIQLISSSDLEFQLIKAYALSQGVMISSFQIFQQLKKEHKISKDKFYTLTKKLQDEKIIFFLQKYQKPKANKKIFLIDFAIKSVLTFHKYFNTRFENIIFLELIKTDEEIFYTDFINFYLPKKDIAIITSLFVPQAILKTKLLRMQKHLHEHQIKKVEIITLNIEHSFEENGIFYEILPFWDWALQR